MKRTLFRWGAALSTLALLFGLMAIPAWGQTAEQDLTCPFTQGIVVDLGTHMIRSDLTQADAETGPVAVTIPAGRYDISLYSYDPHDGGSPQSQDHEQWLLADVSMVSGATPSFLSGVIDDLPNALDFLSQQVNTDVLVPDLTELWARHAFWPTSGDPETYANSIHPVCAAFVPVKPPPPPPTTTTTTSPLLGSIGNFVWNDANTNGIQDAGEVGVAGVAVNLLDGSGTLLASTSTDADGHYRFGGLLAGDYVVEFLAPVDWEFSPTGQGADETLDSNAAVANGRSDLISLTAGAGELTIDAGMHRTTEVEPTTAVRPTEETLPFTGASSTGMGGAAIGLVLLGGLVLLAVRGKEDNALVARHRAK